MLIGDAFPGAVLHEGPRFSAQELAYQQQRVDKVDRHLREGLAPEHKAVLDAGYVEAKGEEGTPGGNLHLCKVLIALPSSTLA